MTQNTLPTLILGVVGNSARTDAAVATQAGEVIATGRSGPSDIYISDPASALHEIALAADAALQAAEAVGDDIAAAAFALAGGLWPEDIELLRRGVQQLDLGQRQVVVHDAVALLRAGTSDGVGVGIRCAGRVAIAAVHGNDVPWCPVISTLAPGGIELGQRALAAVHEAHLGLGPATSLSAGLMNFFDAASVADVIHYCTARDTDRHWLHQGKLAAILLAEAEDGDPVSQSIVVEAGHRIGQVAVAGARSSDLANGPVTFVLGGDLISHRFPLLAAAITARIMQELPAATVASGPPEPAIGALLLAQDLLNVSTAESARLAF